MNRFILFFICLVSVIVLKAQNNYQNAIKQGDEAFKAGQYKIAINKYFAAEAFDPTMKDSVKKKVQLTFDRIEALRQEAIKLKKDADNALKEAQRQTNLAIEAKNESDSLKEVADAQTQLVIAAKKITDSLRLVADSQKYSAEKNLTDFIELKKTVIGSKYEGGIVISWVDSTGKHGVIAAETDLGKFSWKKAQDTCEKLIFNGKDDWRLPNRTELAVLYAGRNVVGGFTEGYYWSSTEAAILHIKGWCQLFTTGFQTGKYKSNKYLVRPVRSF